MLTDAFFSNLHRTHAQTETFPPTSAVARLMTRVLLLLFPEQTCRHCQSEAELRAAFAQLEADLARLLAAMQGHLPGDAADLARAFLHEIPTIHRKLLDDVQALLAGDPAATCAYEIVRAYPGFYAVAFYRMAHALYGLGIPLLPRVLTEFAHSRTGIDIHPAARIGEHFFIDHGTGIVIGETTDIGDYVKIYQGVTLGALSVSKEMASSKRHPTVQDHVVIYSNATILGGETVIGPHSIIGGNVWLTESVPAHSKVYHQEQVSIR